MTSQLVRAGSVTVPVRDTEAGNALAQIVDEIARNTAVDLRNGKFVIVAIAPDVARLARAARKIREARREQKKGAA